MRSTRRTLALTLVGVGLLLATPASVSYVAFEQITVAGTAIGFTAALITPAGRPESNAQIASCRLRTAQISFTYDTTTPTASVGELLEVGDRIEVRGHDLLRNFRGIRTTGTSGQLDCHYLAP